MSPFLVLPSRAGLSHGLRMATELPQPPDANRAFAHEVVVYTERCAFPDLPGEPLPRLHQRWQSGYFKPDSRMSPAIAALLSDDRRIPSDTVFLSLTDREAVVALRILLALSGVTIEELRSGLEEEHFPPFTAAIGSFVSSRVQILHRQPEEWPAVARKILETRNPNMLIVEGLRFIDEASKST